MNAHSIQKGSQIAKSGYQTERWVCNKFNNWKKDKDAQKWLSLMGYNTKTLLALEAVILHGYKSDISINIQKISSKTLIENIQVKLVSNTKGFNQIDKRWLVTYKEMWNIPDKIFNLLQYYTGEKLPYKKSKNLQRMFLNEFSKNEQLSIINWFRKYKYKIIKDILQGHGVYSVNWILVINKSQSTPTWRLVDINKALEFYASEDVSISPRGSLYIGKITMQRKGGDNGRETGNKLQFKLNPTELFYL